MELLDRIDWAKVGTIAMVTMPIHFGLFLVWLFNVRRAAQARRLRHAAQEGKKQAESVAVPAPAAPTAPLPLPTALPPPAPASPAIAAEPPLEPRPSAPPPSPAKPRLGTRLNRYGNMETYIIKD